MVEIAMSANYMRSVELLEITHACSLIEWMILGIKEKVHKVITTRVAIPNNFYSK